MILWRYKELLPLEDPHNQVSLGEGMTPLLELHTIGKEINIPHLYLKDEGLNPSGSFKARGAAVGVSKARELGVKSLIMPTAGNAGGAWASYCAAGGIKAIIIMPEDAQGDKHARVYRRRSILVSGEGYYQ